MSNDLYTFSTINKKKFTSSGIWKDYLTIHTVILSTIYLLYICYVGYTLEWLEYLDIQL